MIQTGPIVVETVRQTACYQGSRYATGKAEQTQGLSRTAADRHMQNPQQRVPDPQ